MKLTQIAVVATALFGGANALAADGRQDGTEKGIDCGDGSQADCTCWTHHDRNDFYPPTLVNTNDNDSNRSGDASLRETGIITYDHDNDAGTDDKSFLEIVVDLDASVYTHTATNVVGGTHPATFGTAPNQHLSEHTSGFANAALLYKNPVAYFVSDANVKLANCVFTDIGTDASTEVASGNGAFHVERGSDDAITQYGTDGANCINNKVRTYLRTEFKDSLGNCGFTNDRTDGAGNLLGAQDDPVTASTYTRYLGRVKVETTRQNGELRGAENVLVEEAAFQIAILFPEQVTVTSSPVSIIGSATYDAQLTHQIYDSANNDLNLNLFVGTTYPFALSTATLAGPNLEVGTDAGNTISASLALQSDPALTAYLSKFGDTSDETAYHAAFAGQANVLKFGDTGYDLYCEATKGGNNPTNGQGAAYNADIYCDMNEDGKVDINDFVVFDATRTGAGALDPASLNYDLAATAADYFGTTVPGSALVARCTGQNGNTQDDGACLQNAFMRVKPLSWYCDFNLALELTLTTVCRDDINGDGTRTDSMQSDIYGGSTGTTTAVGSWPVYAGTSNQLFNQDGSPLPCSSSQYRAATKADQTFQFQLASDNFCPRTIATVDESAMSIELGVYESSFGETTWGAHTCTDQASCEADVVAAADSALIRSSDCDGSGDHAMCVQVPGYAADSDPSLYNDNDALTTNDTPADQRKTQNEFVFGTTTYLETRVSIDAGVNIASTTIDELWIAKTQAGVFPTGSTTTDDATWQKRLIFGGAINSGGLGDSYVPHDGTASITDISPYVTVSNKLAGTSSASLIIDQRTTAADVPFFDTNPAVVGSAAARLGEEFEGVSRATVQMNKYTVQITDVAAEDAEPITFHAKIAITYKAANDQGELGTVATKIGSDAANRARSLAAPTVTGGQASAQAGIRPAGTTGAAGSSSTIAGFSSTTVLAAAAVLGAIVVAAGASFFVVRKRRTAAAKTAKRSSSSTELNDTAQVQV